MSDNPQPIEVQILAKVQNLMDGLKQATEGVQGATNQMSGILGGLQSAFGSIKTGFIAVTAVLAGGKVFKDAVKGTVDWTMEVDKLSKALGVNLQTASVAVLR